VYLVHDKNGTPVVLKTNFLSSDKKGLTNQYLLKEAYNIAYLARLHITEGVLRLLDCFWFAREKSNLDQQTEESLTKLAFGEDSYIIVVPYAGVKLEVMFTCNYDVAHVRYFAKQQLKIIGQLRKAHMVHGDIKPANIVYNPDTNKITLLDFVSLTQNRDSPPHSPTMWYRAPEYLLGFDTSQGDIWSLACVFYELGSGGNGLFPVQEGCEKELLGLICKEIGLPKESYASKSKWFSYFFCYDRAKQLALKSPSLTKPCIPSLNDHMTKKLRFSSDEVKWCAKTGHKNE